MTKLEQEAAAARQDADNEALYNGGGHHLLSELQAEVKALRLEKQVLLSRRPCVIIVEWDGDRCGVRCIAGGFTLRLRCGMIRAQVEGALGSRVSYNTAGERAAALSRFRQRAAALAVDVHGQVVEELL